MAVVPSARGVAHVVFEGPFSPISWAATDIRGQDRLRRTVEYVARLFGRFQPLVLVLQDMDAAANRPSAVRRLNDALALFAESQGVEVVRIATETVRDGFAGEGATTRQRIAELIAKRIPMLARLVPPPRKLWQTESRRMGVFDSAALVQTFYRFRTTSITGLNDE